MNRVKLILSIIYFIIGGGLIVASKYLPSRYYLKMRHNCTVLDSHKVIKSGKLVLFLSGICWLIISYLFFNNINIIMMLWINIGIMFFYNIVLCLYIEKNSEQL